jgi:hypothetical protein
MIENPTITAIVAVFGDDHIERARVGCGEGLDVSDRRIATAF